MHVYKKIASALFISIAAFLSGKAQKLLQKPNIIFILADDLGYGDLGCYGQKLIKTPHIDKLASEGIRFTQHYAGSTVCAPSRASLLTGLHTGHTYIRANADKLQLRASPQDVTVAEHLQKAGYKTAMIGKSSTGCGTELGQPNEKGFDYFYGYLTHRQAHACFPKYLFENTDSLYFPNNGDIETWRGDTYSPDLLLQKALGFIDSEKDKPFFLFYATTLPHAQMFVPEEFKKQYSGKFEEIPYIGKRNYGEALEPNAITAGMISRLDWEVGKIMQRLKDLGIEDNTIIVFSSDNGPHREGGRQPEFFNSSGGLRGIKRDLYEGGIRVPLIVKWKGVAQENTESNHISAFWDMFPTFIAAAGGEIPENIDGISFLPTLANKKKQQKKHDYLYWEFYEGGGKQAVRKGDWKAVRLNARNNPNAPIELYNLSSDLYEQRNIAAQYPKIVAEMRQIMKEARTESEVQKFYRKDPQKQPTDCKTLKNKTH